MIDAVSSINNFNAKSNIKSLVQFRGEQAPVDMEQQSDTFEKEDMSTGKKAAIGIGGLLALIATGFGIKKGLDIKAANRVLKEAAQAVGIEDVNLYKNLKSVFENISVFERENLEYPDIVRKISELTKQGKVENGDKLLIMPRNQVEEMLNQALSKKVDIPENSIAIAVESADGKNIKYSEFILHNGLYDGLVDLLPNNKIYAVPLKV